MNRMPPIAVVGLSGVFPGAHDRRRFWDNVLNKVDATCETPAERWIAAPEAMCHPTAIPDKTISRQAGLITDFRFDPTDFALDPDLLTELDPLYHLALHAGREAFAGCGTRSLDRRRAGVVLAAIALPTDTASRLTRDILGRSFEKRLRASLTPQASVPPATPLTPQRAMAGRVTGFPASILARALGLGGESVTLDAACASSLYAVKIASDALHARRADLMLAGGVSRPECLYTLVGFSQLRALSPTGRCAPFDASADGLVVGEGAGILALKRLEDALAAGDRIWGLIHGVGLSNDMRGNLLAPDSEGQLRAMRQAYRAAGWSPGMVDLVECHGTGTPTGDRTELASLQRLWQEFDCAASPCALGSVKSMIGHLLTAAGAAGLIKTLLALNHEILPPSLHFSRAPADSPLRHGAFHVQTEPREWPSRNGRRAAVSAFGFGGINAHLLAEAWRPSVPKTVPDGPSREEPAPCPIAIVGMDAAFGALPSLRAFQEAVFRGATAVGPRPAHRWRDCEGVLGRQLPDQGLPGGFIHDLELDIARFHIPPNEIPEILPQQLLMLKVAAGALEDAGLPLRQERPDMGAVIGIGFDYEATNFHLRWQLSNLLPAWAAEAGLRLSPPAAADWLAALRDACGPPLNAVRTLGALGGIVASRIAREFRFGGPSFVVSNEEASGLNALEIAVRALQQKTVNHMLVGAVDLAGDIRNVLTTDALRPFSRQGVVRPFDRAADGCLPGEGATAVVLRRLEDALAAGDRIYAVIRGIGQASADAVDTGAIGADVYGRSLERAFQEAAVSPATVGYIETHGSGHPAEDRVECEALHRFFPARNEDPCALGSVKATIGHTGAAAGLAALVKTALCLHQELLPPLANFTTPAADWNTEAFHIPVLAQYWPRNRVEGPRRACVAAMTIDGGCFHVVLEGQDPPSADGDVALVDRERRRPLGAGDPGLFVVEGNDPRELQAGLAALDAAFGRDHAPGAPLEQAARCWYLQHRPDPHRRLAVCLVADTPTSLAKAIREAARAVGSQTAGRILGSAGFVHSPQPLGPSGDTAFVYPGSGNHFVGMGRGIGVRWPEVLRSMDARTDRLKTQMAARYLAPWRISWAPGWERPAQRALAADSLHMIFGQVIYGGIVTELVRRFDLRPAAVIGYSLGESTAYFATGAWADRGEMLRRMQRTDLFTTQLAGDCHAARQAWGIPAGEALDWCAAVVNRPAAALREMLRHRPTARLLIVNTPDECVVGGHRPAVAALIKELGCEAVFLEGVVTVHCDALAPVAAAYRDLHLFPTDPPRDIRYYSCAQGRSIPLTAETAADSILAQALSGFAFPDTVDQAYRDGVRIFVEMGPQASCTRMIARILEGRPHLAVSASHRGEDETFTLLKLLAALVAERVPVCLDPLYGADSDPTGPTTRRADTAGRRTRVPVGGALPAPPLPVAAAVPPAPQPFPPDAGSPRADGPVPDHDGRTAPAPFAGLMRPFAENQQAVAQAHQTFLDFSKSITLNYSKTFDLQARLLARLLADGSPLPAGLLPRAPAPSDPAASFPRDAVPAAFAPADPVSGEVPEARRTNAGIALVAFDRQACMEFAIGSVAKVLGPAFAPVDTYPARVRLPDEPLMLVDRILSIEGEKGSLGPGRVVTEHDVRPGAWYLDGGHAPVCIAVEAGQADLFLCAYLGIDLAVRGLRTYRLLDAEVQFHRELPRPGEVVRYDIRIERFVRQQDTYLFFFHFEGFVGDTPLITMTDGCAGFFTAQEVRASGGILPNREDTVPQPGKKPPDWRDLVPLAVESYPDVALDALRAGNPADAFGPAFAGMRPADALHLPGGRMKLIDRVLELQPGGGRFGLGLIRAEADIHPQDWFLTCHFVDDRVMPGTLMYECCAHTLRVFLQRIGWVTAKPGVSYQPMEGVPSRLKCRGPVTPETRKVVYAVEIKELGYGPEPYAIADADMYADGQRIVRFQNLSLKMAGIVREEIEAPWAAVASGPARPSRPAPLPPPFDRDKILAFAVGNPSEAFGEPYRMFDQTRRIARLPGPPYLFMDRVTRVDPEAWVLKPGGWVEAEYAVPPEAWYFKADRSGAMPYCILLEIALQPCGWLAAYLGSALRSARDLRFRNLGGQAVLHRPVLPDDGTLTMRARMTKVAEAGDMIIETFDLEVLAAGEMIFAGQTDFGFFTDAAMAQQVGLRQAPPSEPAGEAAGADTTGAHVFADDVPLTPDDDREAGWTGLVLPARALRMIDAVECYRPEGGPAGLGFIRGVKTVDPAEWFFKAHFYQDPVCPGSLGVESFLQLLRFMALQRWPHLAAGHRWALLCNTAQRWVYRGQIIPQNHRIEVEAIVTRIEEPPAALIQADGYLKVDGRYIYQMNDFGFRLVPAE